MNLDFSDVLMGVLAGAFVGFMIALFNFAPTVAEKEDLKKQGAIAVYDGRAKCEKALGEWVCELSGNPARAEK